MFLYFWGMFLWPQWRRPAKNIQTWIRGRTKAGGGACPYSTTTRGSGVASCQGAGESWSTQINWGTLGVGQGNHSNYLVIHHLLSYFDLFSIMLCHCISWSSKVCSKQLRDFFCCSTRPPGWQAGKQEHVLSGFWFSSANSIFFAVATIIIN